MLLKLQDAEKKYTNSGLLKYIFSIFFSAISQSILYVLFTVTTNYKIRPLFRICFMIIIVIFRLFVNSDMTYIYLDSDIK